VNLVKVTFAVTVTLDINSGVLLLEASLFLAGYLVILLGSMSDTQASQNISIYC
jgi:hypothetical protein